MTPKFNLAATTAFIDPFRATNYLEVVAFFRWQLQSESGGHVRANNGTSIETQPIDEVSPDIPDFLIISSRWEPEAHVSPPVAAMLRRAGVAGTTLGGIDTGAFVLAHTGLLKGHRATVHYELIDALQELFPDTQVEESLLVFDGARITCCGGVASGEFALHILRRLLGSTIADAAARYVSSRNIRDHNAPQNPQDSKPLGATVPDTVRWTNEVMEET